MLRCDPTFYVSFSPFNTLKIERSIEAKNGWLLIIILTNLVRSILMNYQFKDEASILKWIEEERPVWDGLQVIESVQLSASFTRFADALPGEHCMAYTTLLQPLPH
jgi:hypothetical protein